MENNFMLKIIALLNKQLSKRCINGDLRTLDNTMYVKVLAKLSSSLARKELKKQLKELNNLYVEIGTNITIDKNSKNLLQKNIKQLQNSITNLEIGLKASKHQQAKINLDIKKIRNNAQKNVDNNPISFNLEIKKSKLLADIEYVGKRYSKLFSNISATQKYEKLMSNAFNISDKRKLTEVRAELSAFTSELKANGLASQSTADKWRTLVERSKDLFSAATVVRLMFSQLSQSVTKIMQLDTAMTNVWKVSDNITSREQFSGLLSKWNKLAQSLKVTTDSLISSIEEWSKIGFDLEMSEQLAKVTTIFEKTAEISNEKANSTLVSVAQAYTEIDDFSEEDYVERVEAIGNKINAVGNKYAISSEGIADALQNSSAALKMANNDLDESIAMITAGNKIFQSPEEMGNTLKVISARLRGQKGELEKLGEDTEGMIEGVSKVQTQILNLTGNRVNIFESDNETLKSTYQILLEVGEIYDSLSDRSQASLLEIMFGKQRMSAGASLLLNYEELEKVKNDSMNAVNSMAEEYAKYTESAEASIVNFKEKLTETYSTFMSGDMIKFVADMGSAFLDLVNHTELLRHALLAIVSINIGKGITKFGAVVGTTAKQMNTLGSALEKVKSLPLDDALIREKAIKNIGDATKGLTEKNLKLLLSEKSLSNAEKIAILTRHNLTEEEAIAKLEKMQLTSATNKQSLANLQEATTTTVLSGAMKKLKATIIGTFTSIKSAFLANPLGWILTGIATFASVASTAISNYKETIKETRQANIDAGTTADESADKLRNLYIQYMNLNNIINKTSSQEEEFKTVVEDITKVLGNKSEILNGLIVGTDEYTKSLKEATKAELENQYSMAKVGAKAAEEELKDTAYDSWSGSKITIQQNEQMTGVKEHMSALETVKNILAEYEDLGRNGLEWEPVNWDTNTDDMNALIEYYYALVEARNKLATAENADFLMSSDIYESISTTINTLSESVGKYEEQQYNALKLHYEWQTGIPTTEEEFRKMEIAILDASNAGEKFQSVIKGYLAEDYSELITQNWSEDIPDNNYNIATFDDIFTFKDAENATTKLGELSDQIDKIQSAYKNLKDAMDSYSSTGTITIDQFQSIVEQGSKFLDYLTLEDGQLSLNEQAMYDLAEARIIEMKAQMIQGIIDNVEKIQTEADADLYLASTNYELAESYHALAEAQLTAWYSSSTLSKDAKDEVIVKARNDIAKINELVTSVNLGSIGGSSTKDAEKSAKDYVDSYMDYMKSSLGTNRIDFKTYSNDVSVFLKRMFDEGKISGEEYFDYVQEQLKVEKEIMDSVISAVTYRIDEEIDKLKSEQDAIQDTIDSLREANDEKERAMKLDKARWELMRLQSQRTIKMYTQDKGIVYTNDHTSIREAQENLENLEFEEVINGLEKEKDALGDSIDELEKYKDKWNNIQKQHEININRMHANDVLGQNWEADILSGRIDTLNNFANNYFNIQKAIADAAWNSANEQIKAAEAAQKAQNTYVTPNVPNETPQSNDYWVYQTLATEENSGLASSKIGYLGGDGVIKVGEKYLVIKWKKGFTTSGEASSQIGMFGGSGVYKRYAKGGVIGNDKSPLDAIAHSIGEDYMVGAKDGERILTPVQNEMWEKWTNALPNLQNFADTLQYNVPRYDLDNMIIRNNNKPAPTINIGDIHLHKVNDVDTLSRQIVTSMGNKVLQELYK